MNIHNFFNFLQREIAPVSLSKEFCDKYGMHDNSGIILNAGGEVTSALFCLDLSPSAVAQAEESGCDVIVTHHPAIFNGIKNLDVTSDVLSACIARCLKGGISVISMHLNFDAADRGIDRFLMQGLGGECEIAVMNVLSGGGYGRVYDVPPATFESYCQRVKREFNAARMICYGDGERTVSKVASFCGAGCDEDSIKFALEYGADTFVSSDMKHHHITALTQAGCKVIQLTHYASENYGFERIARLVSEKSDIPVTYYTDKNYL
ncbi:MAG: Nif3-like dinuclear metal center hexameric protein [Clostridia bacterium]|nr:Nif3-like dinuclear metal center hexameric protein [Clostridia bacterium]